MAPLNKVPLHPDFSRKRRFTLADFDSLLSKVATEAKFITLADLHNLQQNPDRKSGSKLVTLRIDVDHDLRGAGALALRLGRQHISATFFLRSDAWYSQHLRAKRRLSQPYFSPDFFSELGHEVGFHNNLLANFLRHGVDPRREMTSFLHNLRRRGAIVRGSSAHGDRLCRELDFRNVEVFQGRAFRPNQERDPRITPHLQTIRPAEFGLDYEAYDWIFGRYVTDVGGTLLDKGRGRGTEAPAGPVVHDAPNVTCILIHPIWWDWD